MRRPVVLLTILMSVFLSSTASGLTVAPIQGVPSDYYSVRDVSTLPSFFSGALSPNSQVLTSTDTLNLTGTATNSGASFSHFFGATGEDIRIGLDFYGSGAITYDYSLALQVSYEAPQKVLPGMTFDVDPFFELIGTPSLGATQEIVYGTDLIFELFVDMPLFIPNIDVDETWGVPDISVGDATFNSNGSGNLSTAGPVIVSNSLTSYQGYLTVQTGEESMSAWSAELDLLGVAADYVPPLEVVDALGFDLNVGLGMPIFREDVLGFMNFSFEDIAITIAEDFSGDHYQQLVSTTVTYDLIFQSRYDYGGELYMNFDGPFFDALEIFDQQLGDFDVAYINYYLMNQTAEISFLVDVGIADPQYCRDRGFLGLICFDPTPAPTALPSLGTLFPQEAASGSSVASGVLPTIVATEEFVQHYQATVPEPGTLLLLGSGLLGVTGLWRRRG